MIDLETCRARLRACGVVPVVTLPTLETARPLAQALIAGGIDVIEVTLRTDCALAAIAELSGSDLECVVGAGTVRSENDVHAVTKAGADFIVTPASSPTLMAALSGFDGLVVPGVSTPSEMLSRFDEGYTVQKLFPAEAVGGVKLLSSVRAPLPDITFMPTGGVTQDTLADYLGLENVLAVGGTWIAPPDLIAARHWDEITRRARAAIERVDQIRGPTSRD